MNRMLICLVAILAPLAGSARGQNANVWASAEFLVWWIDDGPAPVPLATTAPANTRSLIPGALSQPDTQVLIGGSEVDYGTQLGGRFTIGGWLPKDSCLGLEANYLFLGEDSDSQTFANNGTGFLTNPFLDVAAARPLDIANYLTLPGFPNSGSATLTTLHELQGAEVNGLLLLLENCRSSWSLLGGYRFLNVDEDLTFATTQTDSVSFFPGQFVNTTDEFDTRNYFHGGQLGVRGQWMRGNFFLASTVKVALGGTHQVVKVRGSTTTNTGPDFQSEIPVTTVPGGIYAQPTNIGDHDRDRFAVLPEIILRAGVQLTRHSRVFVGYDFLYLSEVARPGSQINGIVNSTQLVSFTGVPSGPLVGPAQPAPCVESTDYWAQGLNFGVEVVW